MNNEKGVSRKKRLDYNDPELAKYAGVKIVNGVRVRQKRFDKSKIQTLIFDKKKFNNSKALKWASDHEFKTNKIDTQKNTLRIRQFDPNKIKKGGECRTIQFGGSGVQGVLCELPDKFKRDASNMHLRNMDTDLNTYFHNGKSYQVDYDQGLGIISVDERYQDKNNVWHTGKNVFFAQGEDGQDIAKQAGGYHVNTIMDYLDSAGVLE